MASWWLSKERKGSEWRRGWKSQFVDSLSPPPLPFIFIFVIAVLFLSLSSYSAYSSQVHSAMNQLNLLFFVLPVLLVLLVRSVSANGRLAFRGPRWERESIHRAGSSPWGVALLLLLLLLMVSYQSSFHSKWYRPLWRRDY
ncbi:hypothetical protein EJ110_NYTH17796 [Nymphaea thermarum]|nr:hypothetical protein EJ110_NYTH17796 [Nymphaea thermarum]